MPTGEKGILCGQCSLSAKFFRVVTWVLVGRSVLLSQPPPKQGVNDSNDLDPAGLSRRGSDGPDAHQTTVDQLQEVPPARGGRANDNY